MLSSRSLKFIGFIGVCLLVICSVLYRDPSLSLSLHRRLTSSTGLHPSKRSLDDEFPMRKIEKAIELAQESLSTIYNRYELDSKIGQSFFFISQNIDEPSYNLLKYQYAKKITNSLSLSLSYPQQYLLTFGGSSVTAGHDNQYLQSYPEVIGRKIRPILSVFNISTLVHNIAQGANNCFPSNYCYETMGGNNPDVIGWEQSFNCGHSNDFFETAPRFALWSNNPGLAYYSQSGSVNGGKNCPISSISPPRCREEWIPKDENLTLWKPIKEDINFWKNEMFRSYKEIGSTASRFGGAAFNYQKQGAPIAVSGSAIWETRDDKYCAGSGILPGKCNVGDILSNCTLLKFVTQELSIYGSANGHGANWHPTIGTHLYRGELISWLLTLSLLDAIYMIRDDIKAGLKSSTELHEKYVLGYDSLFKLKEMPKPVFCGQGGKAAEYCDTKPNCFTDYKPHYSANMSLTEIIVGNHSWQYNYPDLLPSVSPLPDAVHIEARPGYSATNGPRSGGIHLKVKIGDYKSVLVCGYHAPNFHAAAEYYVELNVDESRLTEKYVPDKEKQMKWLHVGEIDGCSVVSNFPSGTHVVTIISKINELKALAGISHVITWD